MKTLFNLCFSGLRNCIFSSIVILLSISCASNDNYDIIVAGGGASGVSAAIQASRLGMRVCIVEETQYLGGMLTAAGVSAIDGNYNMPAGIFGELRRELEKYYGGPDALKTGWVSNVLFEPSVADSIFHAMVAKEPRITVIHGARVFNTENENEFWSVSIQEVSTSAPSEDSYISDEVRHLHGKILIDATELGDVAAMSGVSYDVGMEARSATGESIAPENANDIIQDMTWVAVLKDYSNYASYKSYIEGKSSLFTDSKMDSLLMVDIPPSDYDKQKFACCCKNALCVNPSEPNRLWEKDMMLSYGRLPGGKYMINWPIEGNDYYSNIIEMTPSEREHVYQAARNFTRGFVYFIRNELGFKQLGLADDEFKDYAYMAAIPYVRESRRIEGKVRFTLNDLEHPYANGNHLYRTSIAVGDYPVDHHHGRYTGEEQLPDLHFHPVPSFGLPLGVIIPEKVEGLLVAEKSISVSNIANGATRLQPVVMQIGQAAGVLASIAIINDIKLQDVSVRQVQDIILASGGYLLPYLDVPVSDSLFKTYQRVGATGILRAEGKSVNWKNETWLHVNDTLVVSDLLGLLDFYPYAKEYFNLTEPEEVYVGNILAILNEIARKEDLQFSISYDSEDILKYFGLVEETSEDGFLLKNGHILRQDMPITRGDFAYLVDKILDTYHAFPVDIEGNIETCDKNIL